MHQINRKIVDIVNSGMERTGNVLCRKGSAITFFRKRRNKDRRVLAMAVPMQEMLLVLVFVCLTFLLIKNRRERGNDDTSSKEVIQL